MTNRRFILVVTTCVASCVRIAVAAVTVEVSNAAGTTGQLVELAATLAADVQEPVAGVENDLSYDPGTPIATGADGRPDCSPNPAIHKSATAFGFRPIGCDPQAGQCTGVHALVVAVDNVDAIPSGATLYHCRIAVSRQARPGRYPIRVTNALYAPPSGEDRAALGSDGAVTALDAMQPSAPPANGAGAGCQVGAVGSSAPLWLALGLLAWRRRRSRSAR